MHISHAFEKVDIQAPKVDIESLKADIQTKKIDIEQIINKKLPTATTKTRNHITKLYAAYKTAPYFGRTDAVLVLNLKPAMVTRVLQMMLTHQLLESVQGKGKGKYRFVQF